MRQERHPDPNRANEEEQRAMHPVHRANVQGQCDNIPGYCASVPVHRAIPRYIGAMYRGSAPISRSFAPTHPGILPSEGSAATLSRFTPVSRGTTRGAPSLWEDLCVQTRPPSVQGLFQETTETSGAVSNGRDAAFICGREEQ